MATKSGTEMPRVRDDEPTVVFPVDRGDQQASTAASEIRRLSERVRRAVLPSPGAYHVRNPAQGTVEIPAHGRAIRRKRRKTPTE